MQNRDQVEVNQDSFTIWLGTPIYITMPDVKQLKTMLFLPNICMSAKMKDHTFHTVPAHKLQVSRYSRSWSFLYAITRIARSVPVSMCTKTGCLGLLITQSKVSVFIAALFYAGFVRELS